jgi:hypothetical protein
MVSDQPEAEKTIIEVVTMLDDGSLEIATDLTLRLGGHAVSGWIAQPGTPDFIEFGLRHNVTTPGEISTIIRQLINGEWHESQERSS